MNNRYLVVWDQLGLEAVWDLGAAEEKTTFETLAGTENAWHRNIGQRINYFMMRARFNGHRHYEIYLIETATSISKQDLENMFEENPQSAADLIRSRGVKILSDRENPSNIHIR
jgi:hypothetical protein